MNTSSAAFRCLCVPVIVMTVISIVLFVFVLLPLREKISVESDDIQRFHAKTEYAERKIARLPEIEAQFGIVKEDEQKLSLLLTEDQVVTFIEKVEELAAGVGGDVVIAQGTVLDAAKKQRSQGQVDGATDPNGKAGPDAIADDLPWEKWLPLKITFTGKYATAVNFLHKIETMPYRLDVVSIGIRPFVPEDDVRSGNAFVSIPVVETVGIEGEGESPVVPVDPKEPLVTASFDLLVYTN